VFLVFCLLTNIIVTSMLILGGASVVNALTGGERMTGVEGAVASEGPPALCAAVLLTAATTLGRPPQTPKPYMRIHHPAASAAFLQ